MKKVFLCAIFALACVSLSAQVKGFEKSISFAIAPDLLFSDTDISARFVAGYRFNQKIFLGGTIGVTYKMLDDITRIGDYYSHKEISDRGAISIPVTVRFKFNFIKRRISPYLSVDAGYNYGSGSAPDQLDVSGVIFNPAIGVDFGNRKIKSGVYLQLGLYVQDNVNMLTWDLEEGPYIKPELRVGFRF